MRNDGGGAQTEERVRFVYGFMRRSKSSTGMRRAHLFSGVSGGRRSASAAVDGATAIPHLNEDLAAPRSLTIARKGELSLVDFLHLGADLTTEWSDRAHAVDPHAGGDFGLWRR